MHDNIVFDDFVVWQICTKFNHLKPANQHALSCGVSKQKYALKYVQEFAMKTARLASTRIPPRSSVELTRLAPICMLHKCIALHMYACG